MNRKRTEQMNRNLGVYNHIKFDWCELKKTKPDRYSLALTVNPLDFNHKPFRYSEVYGKGKGMNAKIIEQFEINFTEKELKKFFKIIDEPRKRWFGR